MAWRKVAKPVDLGLGDSRLRDGWIRVRRFDRLGEPELRHLAQWWSSRRCHRPRGAVPSSIARGGKRCGGKRFCLGNGGRLRVSPGYGLAARRYAREQLEFTQAFETADSGA